MALAAGTAWAHEAHGDHYLDLAAMMESGASVGSDVTAAPAATPDTSGDVDIFAQMADGWREDYGAEYPNTTKARAKAATGLHDVGGGGAARAPAGALDVNFNLAGRGWWRGY